MKLGLVLVHLRLECTYGEDALPVRVGVYFGLGCMRVRVDKLSWGEVDGPGLKWTVF